MTTGVEMMIKSVAKMLGFDPIAAQSHIETISKSLHTIAVNSDITRRNTQAIMSHLGIAEPLTPELINGRDRTEERTGSEGRADA